MSKKKTRFVEVNPYEGVVHSTEPYKKVTARNPAQKHYIREILSKDIICGIGSYGGGKTTVAAGIALELLMEDKIDKIILSRPVMIHPEDQLGFAPGNIDEKMYPFLKPLYDAFRIFISDRQLKELMSDNKIEILPFCYMRGSNVHGVCIVDEAENLSWRQIKLVLTRLCKGGKLILSGDPAQSDLPKHKQGAFEELCERIGHLDRVGICEFSRGDSQRHPIIETIQKIIDRTVIEHEEPIKDFWRDGYV